MAVRSTGGLTSLWLERSLTVAAASFSLAVSSPHPINQRRPSIHHLILTSFRSRHSNIYQFVTMRLQYSLITVLSLTSLTSAAQEQQHPLRSFMSKLSSYIPSTNPQKVVESVIGHTRANAAAHHIEQLTLNGWRATLKPSTTAATGPGEPEEWWVLVTGRNKSCPSVDDGSGGCEKLEKAFNVCLYLFYLISSYSLFQVVAVSNWIFSVGISCNLRRRFINPPPSPSQLR